MSKLRTHSLGFPRIGEKRELKRAAELVWQGRSDLAALESTGRELRMRHWRVQADAGIDLVPSNDFSFYDQVLDTTCLVGNIPKRFHWDGGPVGLDLRFEMARGRRAETGEACCAHHGPGQACEMTKWFDTNYHYLVPEFHAESTFRLSSTKPFDEFAEALAAGLRTKPVLIGPVTYLTLGKARDDRNLGFDRFQLLSRLLPVYAEVLRRLQALGAEWVQLDEPIFALDLGSQQRAALAEAYGALSRAAPGLKLLVASYFGPLRDNLAAFAALPVQALHTDFVRAPEELDEVVGHLAGVADTDGKRRSRRIDACAVDATPSSRSLSAGQVEDLASHPKILSLGIVDARNIWRTDYDRVLPLIERAVRALGPDRVWLAPSCSLLHVPVTLRHETKLDRDFLKWLAFAEEKLVELRELAALTPQALAVNRAAQTSRRASARIHRPEVKARAARIRPEDLNRRSPFARRQETQRTRLRLPLFPTTTIGSFPQTEAIRAARASWKKGALSAADYERFLEEETAKAIRLQEEIGIDVLVHGEFERNDMVEYFGERLDGYAFTQNGWVQSYGSRCVKPPVIFGDVARPAPMTVRWTRFAQSRASRPVKGMLTGPITMLQWSFVRDDQPRSETARQIALAIRDEVLDLEAAGAAVIQIDEPALREGLPLRQADAPAYLQWAVAAFRLAAAGVRDDTQIHTHMCYAEFNDIIGAIADLDADVVTIETSRSNLELLDAFVEFKYPAEIGPGVYDIHSPRVPEVAEMTALIRKAAGVLPPRNLWVNPDCGLKTRAWAEVTPALRNLVAAARELRESSRPR